MAEGRFEKIERLRLQREVLETEVSRLRLLEKSFYPDFDKFDGEKAKEIRSRLGLTREDLSDKLKISCRLISNFEAYQEGENTTAISRPTDKSLIYFRWLEENGYEFNVYEKK